MSRMTQPPSLFGYRQRVVWLWYIPPCRANGYRSPLCEPGSPLLLPSVSDPPLGEDGSEGIWGNSSDSPAVEVEYPVESSVGFVLSTQVEIASFVTSALYLSLRSSSASLYISSVSLR